MMTITRAIATAFLTFIFFGETITETHAVSRRQHQKNKRKTKSGTANARQKEKQETNNRQKQQIQDRANARQEALTSAVHQALEQTENELGLGEFFDTYGEIYANNKKMTIVTNMSKSMSAGQQSGKNLWIKQDYANLAKYGKRMKSTKWDSNVLDSMKNDANSAKLMKDLMKSSNASCEKAETYSNNMIKNYKTATDNLWTAVMQEDQKTAGQGKGRAKFFDPSSKDGQNKINAWANTHLRAVLNGK